MTYVHGYDPRENERLQDQAGTLVDLLHADTAYPAGSRVLEAGCGVGAQTVTLALRSPQARFTSVDISADSVAAAERRTERAGATNVEFRQGDIFALPFDPESFDHVFVCFVLEHLARPVEALTALGRLVCPGGTDHGHRGRSRVGLLPPRQPRGTRRRSTCQVRLQAGRRRQRAGRPRALPADGGRGARLPSGCRRGWSTWTRAGPASSTGSRAGRSRR